MNIIYMHTHDSGRFLEPYGYNVPTPNIMELAKQSSLFRQAFCAGPTCSPSRASLLTGTAPHVNGMIGLAHRGFKLNDYSQHLVQFLNQQGYETVLSGVQHEAVDPKDIGYQKIISEKAEDLDRSARDLADAKNAAEYIKQQTGPFFLAYGMFNTHRVFPDEYGDINPDYVMPPFPFPDSKETREDMASYMASAKIADTCVGIVLDALKESGHINDTLVIFTTDHGIAFPWMKCNLYDTGIGVSLMMAYPGNKSKGEAIDGLVSHIDVFPTICDLLEVEKPTWLAGKSLLPLLEGDKEEIQDEIFSEVTFHAAYEPMRCIRTKRYKYIRFCDEHNQVVPANIDAGYTKSFLVENGLLEQTREKEMLFDLYFDPVERVNLVNDASYQGIHNDLSNRLTEWMKNTNDPLLKGKVPKPKGARVNKLSSLNPSNPEWEE